VHLFQIFASVACDLLWFNKNKAMHDGVSPYVLVLSSSINKVHLEHFSAWKKGSLLPHWKPRFC
jgi:hypothetical protein